MPFLWPSSRSEIVHTLRQPLGHIGLRVGARLMEWISDVLPKKVNCSDVTEHLAVGGAFRRTQIPLLKARGVTAVVDCRSEAKDDVEALRAAGIEFLHLPAPDKYALSLDQLGEGVDWVRRHITGGGKAFLHCEHGVGRGPLMGCAVLVSQGHTAAEALQIVRAGRWQALPNDRQLSALLAFEQAWRARTDGQGDGSGESVAKVA